MRIVLFAVSVVCLWGASGADEWQTLFDRAQALERAGDAAGAVPVYRQALSLAEQFPPSDLRLPKTLNSLAISYSDSGWDAEAQRVYRRLLTVLERTSGKMNSDYAVALDNLAASLRQTGQRAQAESLMKEAVAILEKVVAPDDERLSVAHSSLAEMLLSRGKTKEADALMVEALAVQEKHSMRPADRAIALNNLGVVRRFQHRFDDAVSFLEQALATVDNAAEAQGALMVRVLNNLAVAYAVAGRPQDADRTYRRAVTLAETQMGTNSGTYSRLLENYAAFLRKVGRKGEAKALETRAGDSAHDERRRNGLGMTVDVNALRGK